jgi:hypothetical protein
LKSVPDADPFVAPSEDDFTAIVDALSTTCA